MKFHRGHDGWGRDSYAIPTGAVAGSSDCGDSSDSPAPTDKVMAELEAFRMALAEKGIMSRFARTCSGNCCMTKVWVCVTQDDYRIAKRLAKKYLLEHNSNTRYIHDAD